MGDQRTETLSEYMSRVRRDIHRHPETALDRVPHHGFSGPGTGKMGLPGAVGGGGAGFGVPIGRCLAAGQLELAEMIAREEGVDPELMQRMAGGKTGVVGILKRSEGPVAALRVDMDALGGDGVSRTGSQAGAARICILPRGNLPCLRS